jgi:hypothetical protein
MKFTSIFLITASAFAAVNPAPVTQILSSFGEYLGPMTSCGSNADILRVTKVVLAPYPIRKGQSLSVSGQGELSEDVGPGAYVELVVKAGIVPLLKQKFDLCENAPAFGIKCPLAAGVQTLQLNEKIPGFLPSVAINVEMKVYNDKGKRITCLEGKLQIA